MEGGLIHNKDNPFKRGLPWTLIRVNIIMFGATIERSPLKGLVSIAKVLVEFLKLHGPKL
jgi:hypothetical protein